jgi:hypothetical protein
MLWWITLYTPPGIGLWRSSLAMAAAPEPPLHTNLPAHAILQPGGNGWECARGYRREGEDCVQVSIPPQAYLDYFGHDWRCERGYRREGDRGVQVPVPPQAFLDSSGHAWECERGYRQESDRCVPVPVPAHAYLDYFGHDWQCARGYRREGDRCEQVRVPPQAFLSYFGHDWECEYGYRREGDRCVSVSPDQTSLARTGEAAAGAALATDALAQLATDVSSNREAAHEAKTVAHLQRQLHQAGYDPGPIDGLLGPRTLTALQQFLTDRGLVSEAPSRVPTSPAPDSSPRTDSPTLPTFSPPRS